MSLIEQIHQHRDIGFIRKSIFSHEKRAKSIRYYLGSTYDAKKRANEESKLRSVEAAIQRLQNELEPIEKLDRLLKSIDASIKDEEAKYNQQAHDQHKRQREIMKDRHDQIMQLLEKMDGKRLQAGASTLQIEQERTRRALQRITSPCDRMAGRYESQRLV